MFVKAFISVACTAAFLMIQVSSRSFTQEDLEACFGKNGLSLGTNSLNVSSAQAKGVIDCIFGENEAAFAGRESLLLNELMQALEHNACGCNPNNQSAIPKIPEANSSRSRLVRSPSPDPAVILSSATGRNCSRYDCYVVSDPVPNVADELPVISPGNYEACFDRSNITLEMDLSKVTPQQAESVIVCIQKKDGNVLSSNEVLLFDGLVPVLQKAGCIVGINTPENNRTITGERPTTNNSSVRVARSPPRKLVRSYSYHSRSQSS